jgi:NAD(P)-dependent dehydrogenase (short-subunit alcohol dehydrogenase family)
MHALQPPNLPTPEDVAVVVGATGGIGSALLDELGRDPRYGRLLGLSRTPPPPTGGSVVPGYIDVTDEASIEAAAAQAKTLGTVRLVIVASGMLHDNAARPERTWAELRPEALMKLFAVNAIGPALVARHFLPLLPRNGRSVFASISARVGSIEDNRLGGWHSYRASKAALNMLLKTLSIELKRRNPSAICVGLHPGTVDTALSKPFQGSVAPGKLFSPDQSAAHLLRVIEQLTPADSGAVFAWDGSRIPA